MVERVLIAGALIALGFALYRALLFLQNRRAASSIKHSQANRPLLLIFTSSTCAPCKLQQIPIVEKLMLEWSDKVDALVVDVTEQPDISKQYGVWSLPTTIVVGASQNVIAINQGVASERKLREQFSRATGLIRALPEDSPELSAQTHTLRRNGVAE